MQSRLFHSPEVTASGRTSPSSRQVRSSSRGGGRELPIVLVLDRLFLKHAAVTVASAAVASPHSRINLYIACNSETLREFDRFFRAVEPHVGSVTVINDARFDIPCTREAGHISLACYNKLALWEHLPDSIDRAIYLDADVIVQQSLLELLDAPLDDCGLAATRDLAFDRWDDIPVARTPGYFNAGVLLVDVESWKRNGVTERAFETIRAIDDRRRGTDQDVLNVVFSGKWKELPEEWNYQVHLKAPLKGTSPEQAAILHYTGSRKPWLFPRRATPWNEPYDRYSRVVRYQTPQLLGFPLADNLHWYKRHFLRLLTRNRKYSY
jgi:lipopolysaccharide biosynthesis glycosyltransferase